MTRRLPVLLALLSGVLLVGMASPAVAQEPDSVSAPEQVVGPTLGTKDTTQKDAPYVPTSQRVVERMLQVANVSEDDVVFDLGSGDGRFVITAAKKFGARGVGIEIDPDLVAKARARAREAGVADQVEFRQGDFFEADLRSATVVTLYLWPEVNVKLRPKLLRQLDPGDRIVSHDFRMGEWTPDRTVDAGPGKTGREIIYFWKVPAEVPKDLKKVSDEVESN